jgi:hypothetical protein
MDERLVAPTPEQVADLLARAVGFANGRGKQRGLIDRGPSDFAAAADRCLTDAGPGRAFAWTGHNRAVAVGWWADHAGRRHVRVLARVGEYPAEPDDREPAVGFVYPGAVTRVGSEELAVCGCGAVGTLAAVGWMGERCGPCHDRAEEGGAVPPPAVVRDGPLDGDELAFTPDGGGIVFALNDRLCRLDLGTGRRSLSPPHVGNGLVAVAFGPGGRCLGVFRNYRVVVWDRAADTVTQSMNHNSDQLQASRCGRYMVPRQGEQEYYTIDWDRPGQPLRRLFYRGWAARGGGFAGDGDTFVTLTADDRFVRVELPSGDQALLRENAFADAGLWCDEQEDGRDYATPRIVAVAPDHDLVCVGERDEEHGMLGPPRLGSLSGARPWRNLEYDDDTDGGMPACVAFSPDGAYLFAGSANRGIAVYPVAGGDPVWLTAVGGYGTDAVRRLAISPDGETLAAVSVLDGDEHEVVLRLLPWRRLLAAAGG